MVWLVATRNNATLHSRPKDVNAHGATRRDQGRCRKLVGHHAHYLVVELESSSSWHEITMERGSTAVRRVLVRMRSFWSVQIQPARSPVVPLRVSCYETVSTTFSPFNLLQPLLLVAVLLVTFLFFLASLFHVARLDPCLFSRRLERLHLCRLVFLHLGVATGRVTGWSNVSARLVSTLTAIAMHDSRIRDSVFDYMKRKGLYVSRLDPAYDPDSAYRGDR